LAVVVTLTACCGDLAVAVSGGKLQQKSSRPLGNLGDEPDAIAPRRELFGTRSGPCLKTLSERLGVEEVDAPTPALQVPGLARRRLREPRQRAPRLRHVDVRWMISCSQACEQASSIVCGAACARCLTRDSSSPACARWIAAIRSRRGSVPFIGF
jgi:hypothetical protein